MGFVLGLHMLLYKKGKKESDEVPRERAEQNSPVSCLFHSLLWGLNLAPITGLSEQHSSVTLPLLHKCSDIFLNDQVLVFSFS